MFHQLNNVVENLTIVQYIGYQTFLTNSLLVIKECFYIFFKLPLYRFLLFLSIYINRLISPACIFVRNSSAAFLSSSLAHIISCSANATASCGVSTIGSWSIGCVCWYICIALFSSRSSHTILTILSAWSVLGYISFISVRIFLFILASISSAISIGVLITCAAQLCSTGICAICCTIV